MAAFKLDVNGSSHTVEALDDMPLLWALRDLLHLTGTKYGCGIGACAACAVLVNGKPRKSCQMTVGDVGSQKIVTIEGVAKADLHPVQQAWIDHDVPQCGYCQAGQIIAGVALLGSNPSPSDDDIDRAFAGHVCRCGTYPRIREAIKSAAAGGKK